MKERHKKAVAYIRVSTKEQEREGFSLEGQRRVLTDYAAVNGIEVVQFFTEIHENHEGCPAL